MKSNTHPNGKSASGNTFFYRILLLDKMWNLATNDEMQSGIGENSNAQTTPSKFDKATKMKIPISEGAIATPSDKTYTSRCSIGAPRLRQFQTQQIEIQYGFIFSTNFLHF